MKEIEEKAEKRAFIALPIPGAPTRFLQELTNIMKGRLSEHPKEEKARVLETTWEKPQDYHITLRYLGDITSDEVGTLERIVRETTQRTSPFKLTLKDMEIFQANNQSILVIRVMPYGKSENLWTTQGEIERRLNQEGFSLPDFGFSPHITIAKISKTGENADHIRRVTSAPISSPPVWTTRTIQLLAAGNRGSRMKRNRGSYRQLGGWPMG